MNSLDAVAIVLAEAGEPLHYKEITRRILLQNLWQTEGKTPDATINAQLAVNIKKLDAKSRFQRVGKGIFALRAWTLPEYSVKATAPKAVGINSLGGQLSFTDAAEFILQEYGEKQPMHYRAITDKIMELNLVNTQGQTPEATLYAQILTEIKRFTKRGDAPRFVKHGKGFISLQKWMGEGLGFQIKRHNDEVRNKLHTQLYRMTPTNFEALVAQLLVALGFEDVNVTRISNDGGIDVRGTLVVGDVIRTRMAIQVKRWKKNVQSPIVQQVRGSLGSHEQGLIITTSDFSKGARTEAERPDTTPVALMDGRQLVQLLVENDIGIQRTAYDLIELDEGENDKLDL
ncbi:MAG: restriction endonuclease [Anaerolineae bacterium]|nr:restriction endonuclease [Anaerolineae bacterium]